jgi:hypothetical protein
VLDGRIGSHLEDCRINDLGEMEWDLSMYHFAHFARESSIRCACRDQNVLQVVESPTVQPAQPETLCRALETPVLGSGDSR